MKKICLAALAAMMLFTACKKGDTGPAGANGANGTNGSNGAAGTNGTNGSNGNANVKVGFVTLTPANWSWDASSASQLVDINDGDVTSAIVDRGMVSVFMSSNNTTWIALPATMFATPSVAFQYAYKLNQVEITCQRSDFANVALVGTTYVKILAISSALRAAHPNTNWKDYNQVHEVVSQQSVQ